MTQAQDISYGRIEVFSHRVKRETKEKDKTGHDLGAGMQEKRGWSLKEFPLIQRFTSDFISETVRGDWGDQRAKP